MSSLFTIGFTQKRARQFFGLLRDSGVTAVIDTRLHNVSQLAGFAKRDDLEFFLRELYGISYRHELRLAPSDQALSAYRSKQIRWADYERAYVSLLRERSVETTLSRHEFENAVLLCSEANAHHCHRRLAAEFLAESWGGVEIVHL